MEDYRLGTLYRYFIWLEIELYTKSRTHLLYSSIEKKRGYKRNFIHWYLEWGSGAYLCGICPGDILLIKFFRWHFSNWESDTCHWKFFFIDILSLGVEFTMWHLSWWHFSDKIFQVTFCPGHICPFNNFSGWHYMLK